MQRTWFWKKFEMSCQVLENITIQSCNSKSRRASNLKLREVDSIYGSAFGSNKDLRRRTKLEPRLNDITTIDSTGAMLCETSAIPSCDTFSITNVDTNEIRKKPANKRSDFAATKREEFAQYENATCNTSMNSSCDILDISDINVNETERNTINKRSEFFVSRNENVISTSNSGILNTAFIDLDEMEEILSDISSDLIIFDEDEEFAQRKDTMSDDSFVIFKSDVDTDVNVYVDFDDTGIDTLNFVNISDFEEEENVAKIEFSSDFTHNVPRCSSTPIISSQQSPIFTSRIIPNEMTSCPEASWILNDNFISLVSSSLVQDKKSDHDDVEIRLNNSIWKQDKVHNKQKNQPEYTKKKRNKIFWKLQKLVRRTRRLDNSISKTINLSGYEADDEDVVSTKKNEILMQG